MAWARGADPKHCIKQFDRMLSNGNFTPWAIARQWASFVLRERQELGWRSIGRSSTPTTRLL
jgi:hypothetical protein